MKIMKLTKTDRNVLRKLVKWTCENCHKETDEGDLQIHRIKRGTMGGEYVLRNIKIVCRECHHLFHYREPGT